MRPSEPASPAAERPTPTVPLTRSTEPAVDGGHLGVPGPTNGPADRAAEPGTPSGWLAGGADPFGGGPDQAAEGPGPFADTPWGPASPDPDQPAGGSPAGGSGPSSAPHAPLTAAADPFGSPPVGSAAAAAADTGDWPMPPPPIGQASPAAGGAGLGSPGSDPVVSDGSASDAGPSDAGGTSPFGSTDWGGPAEQWALAPLPADGSAPDQLEQAIPSGDAFESGVASLLEPPAAPGTTQAPGGNGNGAGPDDQPTSSGLTKRRRGASGVPIGEGRPVASGRRDPAEVRSRLARYREGLRGRKPQAGSAAGAEHTESTGR